MAVILATQIEKLLTAYQKNIVRSPTADSLDATINSNTLITKAGSWYEKLRNLVEYQEEHNIRRSAMERILRRHLHFGAVHGLGLPLLREYVSGGYLPNNTVPEKVAIQVEAIVGKYMLLARNLKPSPGFDAAELRKWCISFAATEVHNLFFPNTAAELTTDALHTTALMRLKFTAAVSEAKLFSQCYIACRRTLLRSTDAETVYALLLKYFPNLTFVKTEAEVVVLAEPLSRGLVATVRQLKKPLTWRIAAKLKNYSIYFSLLKDVLEQQGPTASMTIINNPSELNNYVRKILEARYEITNKQIVRRGLRAVAYIFFTKMLLAIALEFPYDLFFLGIVDYQALTINVLFHPLLLLLMTRGIAKLGPSNTTAVLNGVNKSIYDPNNLPVIVINNKPNRGWWMILFSILYLGLFILTFGAIISGLRVINFSTVSIILFIFFLALVSYFGLRIRHLAKVWKAETPNERGFSSLLNLITLPILRVGRWLSTTFSSINIFVFIMDFIIEIPFKIILRALDAFLGFVREKREEIY